jgi:V8-like Glu-specific endopeptidase
VQGVSPLLSDPDAEIRREAALGLMALPALGGGAPEALGKILQFYSADPETADALIDAALEAENPDFLSPLRAALGGDDLGARRRALTCLGKLGTVAAPDLASVLSDSDLDVRLEAARSLDALPILEGGALDAMGRALESSSLDDETAQILIGTLARRACVSEQQVRWVSERLFEADSGGLEESLRMLDGDLAARSRALLSLSEAGSIVHPLLMERLASFVEDRDEDGIRIAADILREAGGHAVRALRSRLHWDPKNRITPLILEIAVGSSALPEVGTIPRSVDGQALLALTDILRYARKTWHTALQALEAIGPVAVPALAVAAWGYGEDVVKQQAIASLTRLMKTPSVGAMATLMRVAMGREARREVSRRAVQALTTLDQVAPLALGAILEQSWSNKTAALEALETLEATAVPLLEESLSRSFWQSDLEIMASLERIGEAAVPVLNRRLQGVAKAISRTKTRDERNQAITNVKAILDALERIAELEVACPPGGEPATREGWPALGSLGRASTLEAAEVRDQAKAILRRIGPQAAPAFLSMARTPVSDEQCLAATVGLVLAGGDGSELISWLKSRAKSSSHEQLHLLLEFLSDAGTEGIPFLSWSLGSALCSTCKKVLGRALVAILIRHEAPISDPSEDPAAPPLEEAISALAASTREAGQDALIEAWERAPMRFRPLIGRALTGGIIHSPDWSKKTPVQWATETLHLIKGEEPRRMLLEAFRSAPDAIRREIVLTTNQRLTSGEHRPELLKEALDPRYGSAVMCLAAVGIDEHRLADAALDELKKALWELDSEVCRPAAAALANGKKGESVLIRECRQALLELIDMRKKLSRERTLFQIEESLSHPEFVDGYDAPLRDLRDRLSGLEEASRRLIARLAPTDQAIIELLDPREVSAFGDMLRRLKMADFAAETLALHARLVEVSMDWDELLPRLEERRRSVLFDSSAELAGPRERFILFHDHGEHQLACDALRGDETSIELTGEADIERYLDCLGHLGRKDEYRRRFETLSDHPHRLHKRRDVSWSEFCRPAVAAVGWIRIVDSTGSVYSGTGFCISPHLMVTCRHVLEVGESRRLVEREQVRVLFSGDDDGEGASNGARPPRKVITILDLFEGQFDAILLRLDHPSPAWFRLGHSRLVERGDEIAALGFSMPKPGAKVDHNLEFHLGIISNIESITPFLVDSIKVGVQVGPGMSGAPVINSLGEVIAILTQANVLSVGGAKVDIERLALFIDPVRDVIHCRGGWQDLKEGVGKS